MHNRCPEVPASVALGLIQDIERAAREQVRALKATRSSLAAAASQSEEDNLAISQLRSGGDMQPVFGPWLLAAFPDFPAEVLLDVISGSGVEAGQVGAQCPWNRRIRRKSMMKGVVIHLFAGVSHKEFKEAGQARGHVYLPVDN